MIINYFDKNKVKILVDKVDLEKICIPISKLISASNENLFFIEKILSSSNNIVQLPKELVIKDYFVFTYNYKIFMIIINT